MGEVQKSAPLTVEEVYRAHVQLVARWARRLGGPAIDVEDVVQEVFLAVHRKLGGFRGDAAVSTWLYRITDNVVRHRRRKERWRHWLGGTSEEVGGALESDAPTPSAAVEARQDSERVWRVLDQMKDKYRTVLVLFELEGMSGEKIAELTGARVATVWVWLHRARSDFSKRLAALEGKEGGR
ncbi:MAG: RNA polymerase sigma factor [Myxococcota bacterium]